MDYGKIALVAGICDKSRRGGMADAADSKSVNGNIVRVQVPPPAGKKKVVLSDWDNFFCLCIFYENIRLND